MFSPRYPHLKAYSPEVPAADCQGWGLATTYMAHLLSLGPADRFSMSTPAFGAIDLNKVQPARLSELIMQCDLVAIPTYNSVVHWNLCFYAPSSTRRVIVDLQKVQVDNGWKGFICCQGRYTAPSRKALITELTLPLLSTSTVMFADVLNAFVAKGLDTGSMDTSGVGCCRWCFQALLCLQHASILHPSWRPLADAYVSKVKELAVQEQCIVAPEDLDVGA
ncbi:uncharacterized protein EV420DRAFT_1634173 [Desarmillaria tabescens]|uniref:DUF7770 domain-containing protein n=1 Tax=Armillaria tabescens TaxID=1929756 RepID=A0AA39NQ50_ARMTA|nr:uncharacterized protein EV420DRAFT_1634173 [Desarmillaria tabescens]KAK0469758.1 hypothetical protein EV420DRAFT_1634173 [Desarmillaria tabescens]